MNSSEKAYFGEQGNNYSAQTLAQIFGVHIEGSAVTHIGLELVSENKLKIMAFDVVEGAQLIVGEKHFDLADSLCRDGRWTIITTPTHMSWDGADQEDYDPLFMLTMPIVTLGFGLLAMRLSERWAFSFSFAEDDLFLYSIADLDRIILEHEHTRAVLNNDPKSLELPPCRAPDERSAAELYGAGMKFYREAMFELAVECLQMAAKARVNESRQAMWQLCVVYELGQGVEPDFDVAKLWCERAGVN